jgi:hypothetical protein
MTKEEILDKQNWRLKDNFGSVDNILTPHEKGLLLSCVETIIQKYNELMREPTKFSKAEKRAAELYRLTSKIRYKL